MGRFSDNGYAARFSENRYAEPAGALPIPRSRGKESEVLGAFTHAGDE